MTGTSVNYFPYFVSAVGFINYAEGFNDYHFFGLNESSVFRSLATDGKDIGVDIGALDSALIRDVDCEPVISNEEVADELSPFRIFPNPAEYFLNVLREDAPNVPYTINDLLGRVVLRGILEGDVSQIDLGKMCPGCHAW